MIKTPKFHDVTPVLASDAWFSDGKERLNLPNGYLSFLREIGEAKLYRLGSGYQLSVLAIFSEELVDTDDLFLEFGHEQEFRAYFRRSELRRQSSAVFERDGRVFRQTAQTFEAWLERAIKFARANYSKAEWKRIVAGPRAFSERERRIVEERRLFRWTFLGATPDGDAKFEVSNLSGTSLPFLSVGVRHKEGTFEGRLWLPFGRCLARGYKDYRSACLSRPRSCHRRRLLRASRSEPR